MRLILSQFNCPITLILIAAATPSIFLHYPLDTAIVLAIVLAGALLSFWQEWGAAGALEKLLALASTRSIVLRDGHKLEIRTDHVVPGDVVELSAGTTIPGDSKLITSSELHVDETSLTSESFPVEKPVGIIPVDATLSQRSNAIFAGMHVVSGFAQTLVIYTVAASNHSPMAIAPMTATVMSKSK